MMTTPANIRRRQYQLAVAMVTLGIMTVVWGFVLEVQSVKQRHCLQDSLQQLNQALSIRADLGDQRNKLVTRKDAVSEQQVAALRSLVREVSTATTTAQFRLAFSEFNATDMRLSHEAVDVNQKLNNLNAKISTTPVPAYPKGKCV